MITLYSFKGAWGCSSISPFCVKLETWMRMAEVPHTIDRNFNPFKSPKGKAPYIDDDGYLLGDSSHIMLYLKEKYGADLDVDLPPEQRALTLMIQRTLEDHYYFSVLYSRWGVDASWPTVKTVYFSDMPLPMRWFMPALLRRRLRKTLLNQGTGRHSHQEILDAARDDIDALSIVLGDKPYLLGDSPRNIDAAGFAYVDATLRPPVGRDFAALIEGYPNLVAYAERIRERYWPELCSD